MSTQISSLDFLDDVPSLESRHVHLWLFRLESLIIHDALFTTWLNASERERAAMFHFPRHQVDYRLSHGMLRYILSHYLKQTPESIEFLHQYKGKPYLMGDNKAHLYFNLSHSNDYLLIAISCDMDVGVDIEKIRAEFRYESLLEDIALRYFFYLWTRKEAFLKETGEGVSVKLSDYDVVDRHATEHSPYLCSLTPAPGYLAALASDLEVEQLYHWVFPNQVAAILAKEN